MKTTGLLSVLAAGALLLASSGCNSPQTGGVVATSAQPCAGCDLAELVGHMSGSFASTAQSERDPEFFDIRLHMTPIWPQHATPAAKWLYVEQAMATALDKPYRQRIYRVTEGTLTPQGQRTFVSEVYEFENPLGFAGAYASPKAFDAMSPQQLTKREGCEVLLTQITPGVYEGSTQGATCLSSLRGATYATSKVHIDATGLHTWDQGFDKDGKQVWGAVKGGYEFKRQAQ
jgi:CpeT protein